MGTEGPYKTKLTKRIEKRFPGCFVLKNDANSVQGVPDLIVLCGRSWAMLEVKRSEDEPTQPNQTYYVEQFGEMSYASFIYPENEERVLDELQHAFRSSR